MDIGFDVSQTGSGKAGCGYFSHAMIQAMLSIAPQNKYSLYPSFGNFFFDAGMPLINPYPGNQSSYGPRHVTRETAASFWDRSDLEAALGQPDIIHCNNFWIPVQAKTSKLVYTFYDLGFAENPDWTTEANRIGCFDGVFRSSIAADWIVAISEYSRAHYLRLFPHFPPDRVKVVYPCSRFVDALQVGTKPNSLRELGEGEFWLSVGTIEPRKNQRLLVLAYANYLKAGGRKMPLVLAGGKGWLMDDFKAYVETLGVADDVVMTGYVSDDELIWLYRNCYGNLYPSLFEGFGLPVLEGMQFGAPTLSSNTTSMPEVAGDAAIMIAPGEPESWTHAMLELAASPDKRQALKTDALVRSRKFNWELSASAMLAIYDKAMASPKREKRHVIAGRGSITKGENVV
jgi:glycosyltransferase involved in cell wall biosynthesis